MMSRVSVAFAALFASLLALAIALGTGCHCGGDDDDDDDAAPGDDDTSGDDDIDDDDDDDAGDDDDADCPDAGLPIDELTVPEGFRICVWAQVPDARQMTLSPAGTLFVGSREDHVHAAVDEDGDGFAETVHVIADGLNTPNGVAFRDGDLYVAEVHRITRYDGIEDDLTDPPNPVVLIDGLPDVQQHGWKYIKFGPDGKLWIPQGAPCNVCEVNDPNGTVQHMDADGQNLTVYARGIRNSVGFDFRPGTDELFFTDNGRDEMGDDIPDDELNHAPVAGMHFGFPYCHGGDVADPEFGDEDHACGDYTPPVQKMGPHVAALGMTFYRGGMFPADYVGRVFNAQHGSWNREDRIGYRVTTVTLDGNDEATSYDVFVEGWLRDNEERWGRPVDVLEMPDGSLLISDDYASVVYRVTYEGAQ